MKNCYIHPLMNFLAHIYLSGEDPWITVGNFIGDFVKGKALETYPELIRKGITLHRKIDEFTDNHEIVLKSKIRLRPTYRHYAPVIADVFYDHFLAVNWLDYHADKLEDFTAEFYGMIHQHHDLLPPSAQHMFEYMSTQDWLSNYRHITGINRALTGMSRRTRFDSGMETAVKELEKNYEAYQTEFKQFFPHLQEMCQRFIND